MDKYDQYVKNILEMSKNFTNSQWEAYVDLWWHNPALGHHSELFMQMSHFKRNLSSNTGVKSCIVDIKQHAQYTTGNSELDKEIRGDDRIPTHYNGITKSNLFVFAEYQRKADKLYENKRFTTMWANLDIAEIAKKITDSPFLAEELLGEEIVAAAIDYDKKQ